MYIINAELYDLQLKLLKDGGIENWESYTDAISDYSQESGVDSSLMSSKEIVCALENAGIETDWANYYEALEAYFEYCDYYYKTKDPVAFDKFKEDK